MSDKNTNNNTPVGQDQPSDNLAEQVLKQGGKSAEEVERTGKLDRGDEAFEATFDEKFRTTGSPVRPPTTSIHCSPDSVLVTWATKAHEALRRRVPSTWTGSPGDSPAQWVARCRSVGATVLR